MPDPILTVRALSLTFPDRRGNLEALEEVSFEGPDLRKKTVKVYAIYVRRQLADIVKDQDLSRYIL